MRWSGFVVHCNSRQTIWSSFFVVYCQEPSHMCCTFFVLYCNTRTNHVAVSLHCTAIPGQIILEFCCTSIPGQLNHVGVSLYLTAIPGQTMLEFLWNVLHYLDKPCCSFFVLYCNTWTNHVGVSRTEQTWQQADGQTDAHRTKKRTDGRCSWSWQDWPNSFIYFLLCELNLAEFIFITAGGMFLEIDYSVVKRSQNNSPCKSIFARLDRKLDQFSLQLNDCGRFEQNRPVFQLINKRNVKSLDCIYFGDYKIILSSDIRV